jgi:hypothetical protein
MTKELHIFTGGKGGVGKTLFALCVALYFAKESRRKTLIIDLNFHNADLSSILDKLNDIPAKPLGGSDELKDFLIKPLKIENNAYVALVWPNPTGKLYGRIPQGVDQIYSNISKIIQGVKKWKSSNLFEGEITDEGNFDPDQFIVDTPLSLSNFRPNSRKENEAESVNEERVRSDMQRRGELMNLRPYIWFVWTIAAIQRQDETVAASRAIEWLKKIRGPQATSWFQEANLIHVINPHVLMPKINRKSLQSFINPEIQETTSHKMLLTLAKKPLLGDEIDFYAFYKAAKDSLQNLYEGEREKALSILVKSISHTNPLISDSDWERTCRHAPNVFINPYYDVNLMGFTDLLETSGNFTSQKLTQRLGKVYELCCDYMNHRQR